MNLRSEGPSADTGHYPLDICRAVMIEEAYFGKGKLSHLP